jgi:hypothetical protein
MIKDFINEVSKSGFCITGNQLRGNCAECDRDDIYGWTEIKNRNGELKMSRENERLNPAAPPEPPPTGNGQPVITELIRDLLDRDKMGTKKYGTTLRANNGRDALMDAYQESCDLCMYLKQAIMERDDMADLINSRNADGCQGCVSEFDYRLDKEKGKHE